MADPIQEGPVARIQSVARAKAILDVLAAKGGGWVSLRDIAAGSGLVKTTAFNLVMALVEVRLVEHNAALGAYRLGFELMGYGRTVERRSDILGLLRPYLVRLCATTRETVNLALPCPTDVLIVDSLEGSPVAAHHVLCRHALLLSFDGVRARAARLRVRLRSAARSCPPSRSRRSTPHTTTEPDAIEAILAECRRRGFVEEVEENEVDAACVGAPLLDDKGEAIAAVSVAGPLTRMEPATRDACRRAPG